MMDKIRSEAEHEHSDDNGSPIGSKMNEGMLMPYKKVLDRIPEDPE
jgi:hypothetical protein